ncbi:MAG: glycosyltransferase family 2 protein [Candidatus Eisenbacteria bacterium]|nr:glycosyltransferase family 2 protein [Candidatus Eisenbacteria bacterium]
MEDLGTAGTLPLVSCVVVTHNCRDELALCLKALLESSQGIPTEVFVVDNASADGTPEMVTRDFSPVKLIPNKENVFFAKANNQGLTQARGKYVLIINPDAFVQKDTLSGMVEFMEAHPSAGAASCMFLDSEGETIRTCWPFRTLLWVIMSREPLVRLFMNSRMLRNARMMDWDRRTQREIDVISDAFLMARRSALVQVGFYDESLMLYFTEDDLCMRLKRAGFRIFHNPDTAICHLVSRSTVKKPLLSILTIQRDDLVRYFRKHHGRGAALIAWVAATFELLTWRLYLIVRSKVHDARKTKIRE